MFFKWSVSTVSFLSSTVKLSEPYNLSVPFVIVNVLDITSPVISVLLTFPSISVFKGSDNLSFDTAPAWIFSPVTESVANLSAVTALLTILSVATESVANLSAVTALLTILSVVTAPSLIFPSVTASFANLFSVTAPSLIFSSVTESVPNLLSVTFPLAILSVVTAFSFKWSLSTVSALSSIFLPLPSAASVTFNVVDVIFAELVDPPAAFFNSLYNSSVKCSFPIDFSLSSTVNSSEPYNLFSPFVIVKVLEVTLPVILSLLTTFFIVTLLFCNSSLS